MFPSLAPQSIQSFSMEFIIYPFVGLTCVLASRPSPSIHINKIDCILVNRMRYTIHSRRRRTDKQRGRGIEIIFAFYIQTSIQHSIISNNRKPKIISFSFWNGRRRPFCFGKPHDEDTSIDRCRVMGKMIFFFSRSSLTVDGRWRSMDGKDARKGQSHVTS